MRERKLSRVAVAVLVCGIVSVPVVAQQSGSWSVPRTPDGRPDLPGSWANNSATPLERPEQLADKAFRYYDAIFILFILFPTCTLAS